MGGHGEEQRVLPQLMVVEAARAFESAVNARGQIVHLLLVLAGHGVMMPAASGAGKLRERRRAGFIRENPATAAAVAR